MDKKNVLLISQSMSGGGAEKVIANLSLMLKEEFNVYIITYSQDDCEFEYGGKRENIDIPGGNVSLVNKISNLLHRCRIIKKRKKEWSIDVSVSFVPQTDIVNVLTRTKREKIVIEVSSNTSAAFPSTAAKMLRKMVLKRADTVVAVSKGSMYDLEKNLGIEKKRLSVIYNSCDIEAIKKCCLEKATLEKATDKADIVAVGSFRKPKGHWHLIKAFSLIAQRNPNVRLVILGEGQYRAKYQELINLLGINEAQIWMPGFCSNPYAYMTSAELFVFSSIYEGFGNVIIESMACGTPVISTDCNYGPREILSPTTDAMFRTRHIEFGEYGCLVPHMGDEDIIIDTEVSEEERTLAMAMEMFLKDNTMREKYIEKGFERCKDFAIEGFGEEWKQLLKTVLK